jgi:hypothetical protein
MPAFYGGAMAANTGAGWYFRPFVAPRGGTLGFLQQ